MELPFYVFLIGEQHGKATFNYASCDRLEHSQNKKEFYDVQDILLKATPFEVQSKKAELSIDALVRQLNEEDFSKNFDRVRKFFDECKKGRSDVWGLPNRFWPFRNVMYNINFDNGKPEYVTLEKVMSISGIEDGTYFVFRKSGGYYDSISNESPTRAGKQRKAIVLKASIFPEGKLIARKEIEELVCLLNINRKIRPAEVISDWAGEIESKRKGTQNKYWPFKSLEM